MTQPPWRPAHTLIMLAIAVIATVWLIAGQRQWSPVADEVEFLSTGWNIAHRGSFSMSRPEVSPPVPTAYREPVFPLFIAAMITVVPSLRDAPDGCFFHDPDPACKPLYAPFRTANSLFQILSALIVLAIARGLGATPTQALVAFALLALNYEASKWRSQVLSDYLAMLLTAGICWGALRWSTRPGWLAATGTGLGLGGLILTKAIFLFTLPLAAIGAAAALAVGVRGSTRLRIAALAGGFLVAAAVPTGAWIARNDAALGKPAVTSGRAGIALQARLIYNDATPTELAAMSVWFIRASGNSWARALFPPAATARLTIDNPDGFAIAGHARFPAQVAALTAAGMPEDAAERQIQGELLRGLLTQLPWHALVSLPLAMRGLFIDEFLVLTLPALFVFAVGAIRRRDRARLAVLALPIFGILIHAAITINITRYETPALIALALAGGFVLPGWAAGIWRWIRR